MTETNKLQAVLYAAKEPTKSQYARFLAFLKKRYGEDVTLKFVLTDALGDGFRLVAGSDAYDWTEKGKFEQLKAAVTSAAAGSGDLVSLVTRAAEEFKPGIVARETGVVASVGDGVAKVTGLSRVRYGEILIFGDGSRGMAQSVYKSGADVILFDENGVAAGDKVYRTGKAAGVPVSDGIVGRVVDALGAPLDGKGEIEADAFMPVESPAPAILDRSPVTEPLKTGILTIDSMFPIGKGQRELIIGDRQTGKTSIAIDAILNQKGKNVTCVYVAIGQKAGSVAKTVKLLSDKGAMDYTVVVLASASDSAPLQYIAPYSATAIAEYFMNRGGDVLIVYDDLSKHAVAYRALSLLLGRSPGREAYPGDIFYLHSRLLERSAHLSPEKGGGSITALPIIETQTGDVSAYIPTNVISITDGQIFLESELFLSGQRPAVNVGLSVSRVGGAAQTKAMKAATGTLRLELAQYREMKVFTQFSGDLDDAVKNQLRFGGALMQVLRQPAGSPYEEWQEVAVLAAALGKAYNDLPEKRVGEAVKVTLADLAAERAEVTERIARTGILDDGAREVIVAIARAAANKVKA